MDLDAIGGLLGRGHPRAQPDVQPLLLELAQGVAGDLLVGQGQEILDRFQHDDFGTQPVPYAAQFQPDHARADHAQGLGDLTEIQRAGRIHD